MSIQLSSVHKAKVGTCPHGLPLGACPICNGMGGGGGSSRKAEKPAGEMSWDECNAVWQQMLKAKDLAQQQKNQAIQAQLQQVNFAGRMENMAQKIASLSEKLADFAQKGNASLPKALTKPLMFAAKIAIPLLNVLKEIPLLAQKAVNFVQEKMADISDKLNAIFGELKNSTEKKISEKFKNIKKKLKSIFGIFEAPESVDEEKKVEEEKRIFELKTAFHSLKEKLFKKEKE